MPGTRRGGLILVRGTRGDLLSANRAMGDMSSLGQSVGGSGVVELINRGVTLI